MVNKKGISPVVATALLLVVAVIAVVGFQTWYTTYQSTLSTKVETQSANINGATVERLEVGGTIFLKNVGSEIINVTKVSVLKDGTTCSNTTGFTIAANNVAETTVNVTACSLVAAESAEVLVATTIGVFSEKEIIR